MIIILFNETKEEGEICQMTPAVWEGHEKPVGVEKKKVRFSVSILSILQLLVVCITSCDGKC